MDRSLLNLKKINNKFMKKAVLLFTFICISSVLYSQTLQMTTISINEQKTIRPKNNHIILGVGSSSYVREDTKSRETINTPFYMVGYYKTDILHDNTLGLYVNGTYGEYVARGAIIGAIYNLRENANGTLYILGGLGLGSYESWHKLSSSDYWWEEESMLRLRIELGALYNYRFFDIRATVGIPDYISIGAGVKF